MKQSALPLILLAGMLSAGFTQVSTLSPAAAAAAEKVQQAFPKKPPATRGFRARGAPTVLTRSGSVIRERGPVPTFLPAAPPSEPAATPEPPPEVPAPPQVAKEQVDLVTTVQAEVRVDPAQSIAFDDILFDLDSATLKSSSQEILQGIAEGLKKLPNRRFLVEGHTCDLGDENGPAHNTRLSCLRAEVVCAWLVHFGVPSNQLRPMGFGSQDPVQRPDPALSKAANEPTRQKNRRAALRLLVNDMQAPSQP